MVFPRNDINALMSMLTANAPDVFAIQKCEEMLRSMDEDNLSVKEIEINLHSAILDGLRYGNWPWISPKVDEVEAVAPGTVDLSREMFGPPSL